MLEHHFHSTFPTTEAGIERETEEHIGKGNHIVEDNSSGIAGDKIRTMGCNKSCKKSEESDWRIKADQFYHFHQNIRDFFQQPGHFSIRPAAHLNAKAEEDSCNNQLQNGPAAPQFGEVSLCKETDNQLPCIHFCSRCLFKNRISHINRYKPYNHIHNYRCNDRRAHKSDYRRAHQFPRSLRAFHICNGGRNREEHHRDDHTEHHVDKEGTQRLQCTCSRPYKPDDNAEHDSENHCKKEPVVLKEIISLHNKASSIGRLFIV